MANYSVTTYTTSLSSFENVTALLETKLETIDSTSNTIIHIDVVNTGDNFKGVLIYNT